MKKLIALMLTLMLAAGTLPAFASVIPDNPAGSTYGAIDSDETMQKNEGKVSYNGGTIVENVTDEDYKGDDYTGAYISVNAEGGTVGTNSATVYANAGEISTNEGNVTSNSGTIVNNGTEDDEDGVVECNVYKIENNYGTVYENYTEPEEKICATITNNYGDVVYNSEGSTVTNNMEDATVQDNYGTVDTNQDGADIEYNYGTVKDNYGTVDNNSYALSENGNATNPGDIWYNYGEVTYNAAYVNNGVDEEKKEDTDDVEKKEDTDDEEQEKSTVVTNVGFVNNEGVVEYNNCYGSCLCIYEGFQTDDDGNLIFYPDDDTSIYLYNGTVFNCEGGVVEYNDGIVYNGVYEPANSEDEEGQVVYTEDLVADVSFAFYDDDWMTLLEHIHASSAFDGETYVIEAVDVEMPEVTKSGYKFVEWLGYLMPTSEGAEGEEITLKAGENLFDYDINYAMEFYAVWEKIQSETSSTTTETTVRYTDSHGISKSNVFFFKRMPKNFEGIKVGKDTLVEGEDYILTAVARDENDTELTATQIEFTDKFFEKYGDGLTEIYLTFVDADYELYATNDPELIQVYEA